MSKTSEQVLIEQREKEENQVVETSTNNGQAKMISEAEYTLQKMKELEAYKAELKIKRSPIHVGIVNKIVSIPTKYGYSYRIEMEHKNYYFNSKSEFVVNKMFKIGEKTAFSTIEKPGKGGVVYQIIDQIFMTF